MTQAEPHGNGGSARTDNPLHRRLFRFETGAQSHTGNVRTLNEDSFFVTEDKGSGGAWTIAMVADGMGGHSAGDRASHAIVDHVRSVGIPVSAPDLRARFEDRINRANEAILALSRNSDGMTIGSTMAALLTYGRQFACIWSGDSRVYRVRDHEIEQISRDHTEVQNLIDQGVLTAEEAKSWPRRNVITQAIGVMSPAPLEITQGLVEGEDRFVICSDGLTGHVSDPEIHEHVLAYDPQTACDALVDLTLERGALDNVTVLVVRCVPENGQVTDGARPL
ncbi:MAG: protein phosphatase 2C domain-containing protein [Pseudomonadota bacterium]